MFSSDYPTWTVGVSVNYPVGRGTEEAAYARTRLEQQQAEARLKSSESRAVRQVRDAWRKIEMNARRIETARAARELADQRLDAEQKRFEVGMSTNFLVIQAQRDLAQAKQSQLAATLAYVLSQVDFEALQQAGPQGVLGGGSADQGQSNTTPAGGATAAQLGATSAVVSGARVLGF
jgi:outer membrane protein TolC